MFLLWNIGGGMFKEIIYFSYLLQNSWISVTCCSIQLVQNQHQTEEGVKIGVHGHASCYLSIPHTTCVLLMAVALHLVSNTCCVLPVPTWGMSTCIITVWLVMMILTWLAVLVNGLVSSETDQWWAIYALDRYEDIYYPIVIDQ